MMIEGIGFVVIKGPYHIYMGESSIEVEYGALVIIIIACALIDSGFLQTNIINGRVAQLLLKDGNDKHLGNDLDAYSLTSGVGGFFEVDSIIDFDIGFSKPDGIAEIHSLYQSPDQS